jgi:hypothetical protein
MLLVPPLRSERIVRNRVLVVVGSIALSLAFGEFVLRTLDPFRFRSGWRTRPESYWEKPPLQATNQLGFRGRPITYATGDLVVVLTGDSQVECVSCRDGHLPEDALRTALQGCLPTRKVHVVSLAASGYGPDQELLALREYFAKGYRADAVVLWQTLANDIWNVVFPQHSPHVGLGHLKPTFVLENGRLREPSGGIGDPYCGLYLSCVARQLLGGGLETRFVSRLPLAYEALKNAVDKTLPVMDSDEDLAAEKTHWGVWLVPDSPRKKYGVALLGRLQREVARTATEHGARFFVFDVDRFNPQARAEVVNFPFLTPGPKYVRSLGLYYLVGDQGVYERVREETNKGLTTLCVPVTVPDHVVSSEDPHLNERGNAQVMEGLAQRLTRELGVAGPTSQSLSRGLERQNSQPQSVTTSSALPLSLPADVH